MSASVVALPANSAANNSNTNARRRQTVAETLSADAVSNGGVPVSGGSEKIGISGKDRSHDNREKYVLGRPKDLLLIKKGLVSSSGSPRRKKTIVKPEKSRWETVLNILIKNLLLLAILFWLGQLIWRWVDRSERSTSVPFSALEFEGRISEVETSLKKMTKMTQVQLKVMDERGKQVEDRSARLEKEMRNLVARTDLLDKSVGELSAMGFLSKKEFETFMKELRESRGQENSNTAISLDDIRSYAKDVIMKEIDKHAADGLGRVDFALASAGARVVRHSEPYYPGKVNKWLPAAKGRNGVHSNAQKMLEPSFGEPGQCLSLEGSSGFVEIKLRTGMIPDAVTLEHVAKSVAYDRSSALKDFRVSGWFEGPEVGPSSNAEKMLFLGEFSYDLEKSNAQTFDVETSASSVINMIRLDFSSNHGCPSHTCIYRFRVHGHEPGFSIPITTEK